MSSVGPNRRWPMFRFPGLIVLPWLEPMAYRRPRGLLVMSSSQLTVLVTSFFVALGAGTNYVR